MPLPTDLVVKKGSKTRPSASSSMPVPVSVTARQMARPAVGEGRGLAGAQGERAALGHGVAGVDGDVEDRRLELRRIGLDRAQAVGELGADLDPLAQGAVEQVGHVR